MRIKKELISVRLPPAINKKFTEHVHALGISKNAFLLNIINKELLKAQKKNVLIPRTIDG